MHGMWAFLWNLLFARFFLFVSNSNMLSEFFLMIVYGPGCSSASFCRLSLLVILAYTLSPSLKSWSRLLESTYFLFRLWYSSEFSFASLIALFDALQQLGVYLVTEWTESLYSSTVSWIRLVQQHRASSIIKNNKTVLKIECMRCYERVKSSVPRQLQNAYQIVLPNFKDGDSYDLLNTGLICSHGALWFVTIYASKGLLASCLLQKLQLRICW